MVKWRGPKLRLSWQYNEILGRLEDIEYAQTTGTLVWINLG